MAAGNVFRFDPPPQQGTPHVPLAAAFPNPPGPAPFMLATLAVLVTAWPASNERPAQLQRIPVAPLTQVYGQQPAPTPAVEIEESSVVAAWPASWWSAQSAAPNAGWNIPLAAYVSFRALPSLLIDAWQAPWIMPPRPVVLVQPKAGDVPVPRLLRADVSTAAWPPIWWPSQQAPSSAAWNFVLVPYLGPARFPDVLGASWQPPWIGSPPLRTLVLPPPLSDLLGGTPAGLTVALTVPWPPLTWAPQGTPANAGWNFLPLVPYIAPARFPDAILGAWQPPYIAPPALVKFVPPRQGDVPPRWSWREGPQLLKSWERDWPAQRSAQIVALTMLYGQQPPRYTIVPFMLVQGLWLPASWPAQSAPAVAGTLPLIPIRQLTVIVLDGSSPRYLVIDSSGASYRVDDSSGPRLDVT